MNVTSADVTSLLKAWHGGDQQALERLTPLVYDHLRVIGRQFVRKERVGDRKEATSLVHEAFVRLVDARTIDWQDRAHFLAVAATIMRRILVDAARARASTKRGGGMQRVEHTSALNLDDLPGATTNRMPGWSRSASSVPSGSFTTVPTGTGSSSVSPAAPERLSPMPGWPLADERWGRPW